MKVGDTNSILRLKYDNANVLLKYCEARKSCWLQSKHRMIRGHGAEDGEECKKLKG